MPEMPPEKSQSKLRVADAPIRLASADCRLQAVPMELSQHIDQINNRERDLSIKRTACSRSCGAWRRNKGCGQIIKNVICR